jgi:hypothetical protein
MIAILALVLATLSLAVSVWTVWFARTHWPANGFVRVPRELAKERAERTIRADSLSDRTITRQENKDGHSRVRTGRLRRR